VGFLVIVFHCPQTTGVSHEFLSYIIPSDLVASHVVVVVVVVKYGWLGHGYSAAISYPLGFFTLFEFGGM